MTLREEVRRLNHERDELERRLNAQNVERQALIELAATYRNDRDRFGAFIAHQQDRHALGLSSAGWLGDVDVLLARVRREARANALEDAVEVWRAAGVSASFDPIAWLEARADAERNGRIA